MNVFIESRFDETLHRLALGIEPIDALRRRRVLDGVYVVRDDLPLGNDVYVRLREERGNVADLLPRLERHISSRFVLRFPSVRGGLEETELREASVRRGTANITVRVVEADPVPRRIRRRRRGSAKNRFVTDHDILSPRLPRRRYVPRRLLIPLVDIDAADALQDRLRRPVLFPGAAYDIHETATVLRGRAVWQPANPGDTPEPVRWARVIATEIGAGPLETVGVAHGDDRGEFLLILTPSAGASATVNTVAVRVTVHAPNAAPVPPPTAHVDPLWGLPLEDLASSNPNDLTTRGVAVPLTYTKAEFKDMTLTMGHATSVTFTIP